MVCAHCGSEVPAHSRFCLGCGQPIQAAAPPQYAQPPGDPTYYPAYAPAAEDPNAQRRRIWAIIIGVVALLVLVIGLTVPRMLKSLAAAGRRNEDPGSMVATNPQPKPGEDLTAAPT